MMLRSVLKARALAAASALLFLGGASVAQTLPIQCGITGICSPKDVHEWARSVFDIERLNLERKLNELRGGVELLRKDLERERSQSALDARVTTDGLADLRSRLDKTSDDLTQLLGRAQQLEQLIQTQDRLRQELDERMDRRVSGIAAGVQLQLGKTKEELRGDITRLQEIVSELQKDRTERERALESRLLSLQISLQGDNKNLENKLTLLESRRKTELDELRRELTAALQESTKADLENAEGESRKVRADMEALRRETQAAREKDKLDFERQLGAIKEEFNSRVRDIKKDVDTQATDTKKEVTEIKRSTVPVAVEIDGRTFEALLSERDSYLAAVSRVKNAPDAKNPIEEYEAARADLQKFVVSGANSGFRSSAFYWLGVAQVGARQCREALLSFHSMRNQGDIARHPLYPDAMLQKASCHHMLKEPQERDRWVKELLGQFPESSAASTARTLLPAPAPAPTPAPRKNR